MNPATRFFFLSALTLVSACEQHHTFTSDPNLPPPLDCTVSKSAGFTRPVDLLFVVDNSGSMREEQASLREQLPRLLEALGTGDLDSDGTPEHPAVSDLHVGVISTDMGLPDVQGRDVLGCGDESRRHGDNGVLLTRGAQSHGTSGTGGSGGSGGDGADAGVAGSGAGMACDSLLSDQPFVAWQRGESDKDAGEVGPLTSTLDAVSCLTTLGTQGCGFEQHLEATLKALWPSDNQIAGRTVELDRPFYDNTRGQGGPDGANAGFLRNEPGRESLVIVVMLTDENDCSSHDTSHFVPEQFLPMSDPRKSVGLNLRCLHAQDNLFAVSRYVDGLKALRPGQEHLVQFVAIAGVPTELIDPNIDMSDVTARTAYYDAMLSDPRMQEVEDPETRHTNPNVVPSCRRPFPNPQPGDPEEQKAYPPRRLVEVARAFGEHGSMHSICQDDFTGIAETVLKRTFRVLERSSCVKE